MAVSALMTNSKDSKLRCLTLDNNDGEEIVREGNDWEVVALTESAYAAAPGPKQDIPHISHSNLIGDDNADTARPMFMSGHFGFSSSTHENLPLEPECKEKCRGKGSDHEVPQVTVQQGGKWDPKHEENLHIEGLVSNEFLGVQRYDEKGDNMSFYSSDFGDIASSDLIEEEQSMYSTGKFGSYDDEAAAGMSYKAGEGTGSAEPFENLDHAVNPGVSNIEEYKFNEPPNVPCEAWWRRHAASLYGHAKNANPFWSIVVAAAVMGLAIIGHRWQRDKPQVFQLKPQLVIDNEGSGWILGPMGRLKDVSLSGQHISYIRVSSSTQL
ncbi:hypothetical protein DH2020_025629 [Rehmannia glutinosa]|uniref:Uncharacterized protein n=1 Tax=Rehmannia glutinosa TaxID=99300 RepID=A0ABR0W3I4_REHGL